MTQGLRVSSRLRCFGTAVAFIWIGAAPVQQTRTGTVQVGEAAPDFELRDAHGASYRLSELTAEGPVVIEFFRSGGW